MCGEAISLDELKNLNFKILELMFIVENVAVSEQKIIKEEAWKIAFLALKESEDFEFAKPLYASMNSSQRMVACNEAIQEPLQILRMYISMIETELQNGQSSENFINPF